MNEFLEAVSSESITPLEEILVEDASFEMVSLEEDYDLFVGALSIMCSDMSDMSIEAVAVKLDTTTDLIKYLSTESDGNNKFKKAFVSFLSSTSKWIKKNFDVVKKVMRSKVENSISKLVKKENEFDNIAKDVSDEDIKNIEFNKQKLYQIATLSKDNTIEKFSYPNNKLTFSTTTTIKSNVRVEANQFSNSGPIIDSKKELFKLVDNIENKKIYNNIGDFVKKEEELIEYIEKRKESRETDNEIIKERKILVSSLLKNTKSLNVINDIINDIIRTMEQNISKTHTA